MTQCGAALPTVSTCRSIEVAAGPALDTESRAAPLAIFVRRLVLTTATRTLHGWPLGCPRVKPWVLYSQRRNNSTAARHAVAPAWVGHIPRPLSQNSG